MDRARGPVGAASRRPHTLSQASMILRTMPPSTVWPPLEEQVSGDERKRRTYVREHSRELRRKSPSARETLRMANGRKLQRLLAFRS